MTPGARRRCGWQLRRRATTGRCIKWTRTTCSRIPRSRWRISYTRTSGLSWMDCPRGSPTGPRIRLTWNMPSLGCGKSRSCSSRWDASVGCTNATLARRGRSAGKRYKPGAPSTATKIKIPETNSKYIHKENITPNSEGYCFRRRRYSRPKTMPKITPTMSATQSLTSALRLKLGWMSSMAPPNALAPMKTGSRPNRPVRASGKASAAKATKCTSLSLPSGAGGGASMGQSIATVRVSVTASVRGISRYLRM